MTTLKAKIVSKVRISEELEGFLRKEGVWTEFCKLFDHEFFNMYENDGVCRSVMYAFRWSDRVNESTGNPRYDKWRYLYEKHGII